MRSMARVDYDRMAAEYEPGRALDDGPLRHWRTRLAVLLPAGGGRPIADVGSGTGLFARAFARWYGVTVIGVEPSAGMLREATRAAAPGRIHYLAGSAQHLPLRDGSCDAAWLSTVIHHIPDLPAAAREVRRILPQGAPVLIRSGFPDATDLARLFSFFPASRAVFATFPSAAETVAAFEGAGFRFEALDAVSEETAPSLAAYRARVAHRADTLLALIPDEAFAEGLRRLDAAVAAEPDPEPVVSALHLLVMR